MADQPERSIYAWPDQDTTSLIGRRHTRLDGMPKATGAAIYTYDMNPKGLLHAALVTSPYARAKIIKIDVSPAEKIPGVRATYVFPRDIRDPSQFKEQALWEGDPLVAIAADREEIAAEAAKAVVVEYEVLPHWVDDEHYEDAPEDYLVDAGDQDDGDVEAAFNDPDSVVHEGYYGIPIITHCCWESHGSVCQWDDDGKLTVWHSTQNVSGTPGQFAAPFGLDANSVRVICQYIGGGFGSKFGADSWGIAAATLAKESGRPVKLMLSRATELKTAGNRPSGFLRAKIAAKKDGTLTAWEGQIWGTGGMTRGGVPMSVAPYVFTFPNRRNKATRVKTDCANTRAWRAPNHPQGAALTMTALDDVAAKLGMDSLEFFRKNLDLTVPPDAPEYDKETGKLHVLHYRKRVYLEELDIGAKLIDWKAKWHAHGKGGGGAVKQGLGLSLHTWGGGAHNSSCQLKIHPDGGVETFLGSQDLGTGTRTVIALTIAETLGLPIDAVKVNIGDSNLPASGPSGGSTTVGGVSGSNRKAAFDARAKIFDLVAKKLEVSADSLVAKDGRVAVKGDRSKSLSWKQACSLLGMQPLEVQGQHGGNEEGLTSRQVGGVQMADVSVDTETGVVRINKIVAVQDCGRIIDLLTAESQVQGGVIQSIASALSEERIMDQNTGRFINANMESYKLPRLGDVGEIVVHMLQTEAENNRGVVGLGEPPAISGAAAISNAVCNAIGVRVPVLPMTPERVLAALEKGGQG